jgi:C4-dicarboxylate transporter, DctM subunit
MSNELIGLIGVIVLVLLLFTRMWIGFAMMLVAFVGLVILQKDFHVALIVFGTVPYRYIAFYTFSAVPMFLLMGVILSNTGIAGDLYRAAHHWLGQLRGGLAMASVVACAALAAIMGESVPEVITMGKVAVPEMLKFKYSKTLATGCVAAGGTLGVLIPPSMGFILYGILTEVSIGKLFMAGILPGVLLTFLFVGAIFVVTRLNPESGPPGPKTTLTEKMISLKYVWHAVVLFLLVLGGIYTGIFTPTEAGAIGAFGAIIITLASRRLKFKTLTDAMLEATKTTAMITIMVMGAFIFMKFLALRNLSFLAGDYIAGLQVNRYIIFAAIVVLYIILGMFLDVMSAIILTMPVIYPIIVALGFDPIWYGVVVVLLMEMGMITPPVGMNVFVLGAVTDVPLGTIFRGVIPFVIALVICIAIVTVFPQIALFIPNGMK